MVEPAGGSDVTVRARCRRMHLAAQHGTVATSAYLVLETSRIPMFQHKQTETILT